MSSAALRDKFPISQEEFLVHEMTTCRLPWYSTKDETRSLVPKRNYSFMSWQPVDYYVTRSYEDTRLLFPKRNFLSMRRKLVDYYGTWPKKRQDLHLLKGVIIHPWRWRPVDYYDTRPYEDTRLLLPKRNFPSMRQQLVGYYGTRPMKRQDLYLPRGTIHPWDDNLSTTTVLDPRQDKISIS